MQSINNLNKLCRAVSATSLRKMSSISRLDWSGIYPPIATPFNDDETIACDKLKRNIDMWNKFPFKGYVVQGSNGEYAFLNDDERVDMIKTVAGMIPKDKLILAGSGCESTQATIDMTNRMAAVGAHAALIVTPCYYKGRMTNQAMVKHYTKVADESHIPVILYSVPANTGIDLAPEVIISLAKHPNIIGLKDSGGDIAKIGNLVYKTKAEDFQLLAGSASFLYPALAVGAVGGVCALANILGQQCCELQDLYTKGKHKQAQELQHRLIAPNGAVTRVFGVPGLKTAMSWFGFYGGPTRSPLQPLTSEETKTLRAAFINSNFLDK